MGVLRPTYSPLLDITGWNLVKPESPLWFRGYTAWTDEEGPALVGRVLARYGAARIVVGHTVYANRITGRFDNRAILIDTGMLAAFNGRASALEIRGTQITALYDDGRVPMAAVGSGR
jgi:hypothetical protein